MAVAGRLPAVLLPQVLIECFSVVTSPRRMRPPLSPQQAWTNLRWLSRTIEVRPVPNTMLDDLELVLARHPARGRDVFDIAIVAQMINHGIRTICTCNVGDFRVAGIQAIDPPQAVASYA